MTSDSMASWTTASKRVVASVPRQNDARSASASAWERHVPPAQVRLRLAARSDGVSTA